MVMLLRRSSIRTQNWVTRTTSFSSYCPLSCLLLPQVLTPLLCSSSLLLLHVASSHSSIPHVCFLSPTSPLCVTAARWASHRFLSRAHLLLSRSTLFLFFPPSGWCFPLSCPPLLLWIYAFHVGTSLFCHLHAPLCLPSCLCGCAVSGSRRTGEGARRQEWANRQLSSQMLLSALPALFPFPLSRFFSASLRHDLLSPLPCKPLYPCKQKKKKKEGGGEGVLEYRKQRGGAILVFLIKKQSMYSCREQGGGRRRTKLSSGRNRRTEAVSGRWKQGAG